MRNDEQTDGSIPREGLPILELAATITKKITVPTSGVHYIVNISKINIISVMYFDIKNLEAASWAGPSVSG